MMKRIRLVVSDICLPARFAFGGTDSGGVPASAGPDGSGSRALRKRPRLSPVVSVVTSSGDIRVSFPSPRPSLPPRPKLGGSRDNRLSADTVWLAVLAFAPSSAHVRLRQ